MSSDKWDGNTWNPSVAVSKLPTLPTGFAGDGCKIDAEQFNMGTKIKAVINF